MILSQEAPSTSNTTSLTMISVAKRLLPLTHISYFYQEFIKPFIREFLSALHQAVLKNGAEINDATKDLFYQLTEIAFRNVIHIPYSTRLKDWEVTLYPYFYCILLSSSEDNDQSFIIRMKLEFFLHLLMILVFPNLSLTSLDQQNLIKIELRELAKQYYHSNFMSDKASLMERMIDSVVESLFTRCLQQSSDVKRFESNLFVRNNNGVLNKEHLLQQQREFLQYFQYDWHCDISPFLQIIQSIDTSKTNRISDLMMRSSIQTFQFQLQEFLPLLLNVTK